MKACDDLERQWKCCHGGGQVLVDSTHPLKMYLNINSDGNKELLIPTKHKDKRFKPTFSIGMNYYNVKEQKYLAIELLQSALATEYMCLCLDLIETSRDCDTAENAMIVLTETLRKWYYLLADIKHETLSDREVRGLLGELQFIIDEVSSGKDEDSVIHAWTTHKDANRDFVFDETWSEIKTIEPAKDYITVSSLEQLDHDSVGQLVVYKLSKTEDMNASTFSLNEKVAELRKIVGFRTEIELNQKLLAKGYVFNEQYDKMRYELNGKAIYTVDNAFPSITKSMVSNAICRAHYDITLSQIERWRKNG